MTDKETTWIVVCTGPAGTPTCEYVEGEQLVHDSSTGALEIMTGNSVVRRYLAGTWSNFTEWVSTDSWFGGVRTPRNPLLALSAALPTPRLESFRAGSPFAPRESSSAMGGAVRSPFSGR